MTPRIAVSLGCPSGIGPEVTLGALTPAAVRRCLNAIVFGDAHHAAPFRKLGITFEAVTQLQARHRRAGRPTLDTGRAQAAYIDAALACVRAGQADGLCTAPVSKDILSRAGLPFTGHTELLAGRLGCPTMMLMDGPRLKVALATTHVPLARVPAQLSRAGLARTLRFLDRHYPWGGHPRIAVCGLNPHAGDGGALGTEDRDIIAPALAAARRTGVRCTGPWPADALFARWVDAPVGDVVLALYHDQGLIPCKLLDFDQTVNTTLGLPFPRTSPDHGTAYDIAGRGKARAEPMRAALLSCAVQCTRMRRRR